MALSEAMRTALTKESRPRRLPRVCFNDGQNPLGTPVPGEVMQHVFPSGLSHFGESVCILKQADQSLRHGFGLPLFDQNAGPAVFMASALPSRSNEIPAILGLSFIDTAPR